MKSVYKGTLWGALIASSITSTSIIANHMAHKAFPEKGDYFVSDVVKRIESRPLKSFVRNILDDPSINPRKGRRDREISLYTFIYTLISGGLLLKDNKK